MTETAETATGPDVAGSKPPPPVDRIQYLRPYGFAFRSRNWPLNLLLPGIILFIPAVGAILGPMVLLGYQYAIVESLHRGRRDDYPDFDFNRFAAYVSRGVWPWLMFKLVASFLQPFVIISTYAMMLGVSAALVSNTSEGAIAAAIIVPVFVMVLMGFSLLLGLVLTPLLLRAGLTQDFGKTFDVKWLINFIASMWLEVILVQLFMLVAGFVLAIAGLLLFCVGVLPAMVLGSIASSHLTWQLYELFLARGGEPVPLKPPPADGPSAGAVPADAVPADAVPEDIASMEASRAAVSPDAAGHRQPTSEQAPVVEAALADEASPAERAGEASDAEGNDARDESP